MTIFLDMDGVLADLFGHTSKIHDVETYQKIDKETYEKFYKDVDAEHLFSSLPAFDEANKIVEMIVKLFGEYNILSSPLNFDVAGSIKGKSLWLDQNISIPCQERVFEHRKFIYATTNNKPNILIDDYRPNIKSWNEAGGYGIKFQTDENSLEYLRESLLMAKSTLDTFFS